jgi:hypothetical protein
MNSPLKVRTIAREFGKGKSRVGEAGLSAVENEEISRARQKLGEMITECAEFSQRNENNIGQRR